MVWEQFGLIRLLKMFLVYYIADFFPMSLFDLGMENTLTIWPLKAKVHLAFNYKGISWFDNNGLYYYVGGFPHPLDPTLVS